MSMAKIAIANSFFTAYAALPNTIQGKVADFLVKFQNNPNSKGINLERLANGSDKKIYSVRIDETYRGIVVRQEKTGVYLLLWVDHHDEAYQWAARKRCEVNPQTGVIQIYDVQTAEASAEDSKVGIFASVSKSDLIKLGVPELQIAFVKSIGTLKEFYDAEKALPQDAYEALSWLAEGFPVEEIVELMDAGAKEGNNSDDLSKALESPESLKSFVVIDGEEELKRMLAEPLEKWRVFLHPTQRKIVNRDYSGAARVLGGAGTGKTVVAMHRAKHLAARCSAGEKVLFTTFTTNLASDIKTNLEKICSREELKRIEVVNLDSWVNEFLLKKIGRRIIIGYDEEVNNLWKKAIENAGSDLDLPASFFEEEYNRVIIPQEALSIEKYVKANRNGRGIRLDRKKRVDVWRVVEEYQKQMEEQCILDINTAMYECASFVRENDSQPKYKHIVVDEGQDLSETAFRLLRALAGIEHENDIFIVGDSHQRIYKNRAVLSRCGINVRGRSSTLKINYRTTEEIRKYAFALLKGLSFDDLDEDVDLGDRCQSLTHGSSPVIKSFNSAEEEFEFVSSEINGLIEAGIPRNNICLVGRTHKVIENYMSRLNACGIRAFEIRQNKHDDGNYDGIRIATMHRVKGLEFRYIFVVSVNRGIVPLEMAIDHSNSVSENETLTAEKCLLYVALTRAQKGAYVTSYGRPSEFITQ